MATSQTVALRNVPAELAAFNKHKIGPSAINTLKHAAHQSACLVFSKYL
jgi:hypothetical protein